MALSLISHVPSAIVWSLDDRKALGFIQLEPSVPSRFEFYAMIWGYFDLLEITLKVMLLPWASGSKQIWIRSFKWGTLCSCRSIGCKITSLQSWQSKKSWDSLGSRLHFSRLYVVNRCSSSDPGSIPGRRKLWEPAILQSFGLQCSIVPHLKDLKHIYLDFTAQARYGTFSMIYTMSKFPHFIS